MVWQAAFAYSGPHLTNLEVCADQVPKISLWLTPINQRAILKETLAKRAPDTCIWFLSGGQFKTWIQTGGGVLCGIGLPGAGKTIISAIEHLQKLVPSDSCVVFIFFRHTDSITVKEALAIVARQLLENHHSVFALISAVYEDHTRQGTYPSKEELIILLRKDTQLEILQLLASLGFNALVTSRPSTLPADILQTALKVEISAQDEDIRTLVEQRIISTIQEKSRGMFLLASFQLQMLQECLCIAELEEALEEMPAGVREMYGVTINRITKQPKHGFALAQRIFLWLLYAKRSLTIKELQVAVAICPRTGKFHVNRMVCVRRLASVCGGLVAIDRESDTVRIIHYTACDVLKEMFPIGHPYPHSVITSACIQLLMDHSYNDYPTSHADVWDFEKSRLLQPLLDYAYLYWASHSKDCSILPPIVFEFIKKCWRYPLVLPHYSWIDFSTHPIHIAALYGFPELMHILIQDGGRLCRAQRSGFDIRTEGESTALILATSRGEFEVVNVLLNRPCHDKTTGTNVNLGDMSGTTALHCASSYGHDRIVRRLLQVPSIEVNSQDMIGNTPLIYASLHGNDAVVEALLEFDGIDANLRGNCQCTALYHAATRGREAALRLLLQVDEIDVNSRNLKGETALIRASMSGSKAGVRLLAEVKGINLNANDADGETALSHATKLGHKEIARILLQTDGIDAHKHEDDHHFVPSIFGAIDRHIESVVPLLLQLRQIRGGHARTALGIYSAPHRESRERNKLCQRSGLELVCQ
ncbi:ankyrin [Coprinopsis marcescibilis]|uniref:Ankyrin n=1 Tax=Coprinopsis marcescibilis TaxID=230819 RepID=A0A5C3KNE8_COPMA|nr:ankyrin [Coprinopsis marcescibilis]